MFKTALSKNKSNAKESTKRIDIDTYHYVTSYRKKKNYFNTYQILIEEGYISCVLLFF